jgi:hypothetical protein
MSFDTTFDYTAQIAEYTKLRDDCQVMLNQINAEIACLNTCDGYNDIKSRELIRLTDLQSKYTVGVDGYNETLLEISSVQSLNQNDKGTLYTFWGFSGVSKDRYMCLMICNHADMLADADLLAIVADNVNTTEVKNYIGYIVVSKYTSGKYC